MTDKRLLIKIFMTISNVQRKDTEMSMILIFPLQGLFISRYSLGMELGQRENLPQILDKLFSIVYKITVELPSSMLLQ
jgi:hypothetical protein